MPAPWSSFEPVVSHTFSISPEATRSDFLSICYANDIEDDVVDGFDALREGVMFTSPEDVQNALRDLGQLDE